MSETRLQALADGSAEDGGLRDGLRSLRMLLDGGGAPTLWLALDRTQSRLMTAAGGVRVSKFGPRQPHPPPGRMPTSQQKSFVVDLIVRLAPTATTTRLLVSDGRWASA
jgi:hypothetical protein